MEKSKFLKWILALGIVVVMNLLFNYGFYTFYKHPPQYNDYCKPQLLELGVEPNGEMVGTDIKAHRYYEECQKSYEAAREPYNRNAFVALVVLGIISILASFQFKKFEAISLGLSLGGVISFIVGSIRYWSNMDDKLRFGVLLVAFLVLVWLGIKSRFDSSNRGSSIP